METARIWNAVNGSGEARATFQGMRSKLSYSALPHRASFYSNFCLLVGYPHAGFRRSFSMTGETQWQKNRKHSPRQMIGN
jgi:hypothetical protein